MKNLTVFHIVSTEQLSKNFIWKEMKKNKTVTPNLEIECINVNHWFSDPILQTESARNANNSN